MDARQVGAPRLIVAADSALLARVTALLQPAGLRPPIVGELAALLDSPQPGLLDFLMRATASHVRWTPQGHARKDQQHRALARWYGA